MSYFHSPKELFIPEKADVLIPTSDIFDFAPTLIIGIGPTGEAALRTLKKQILDKCKGQKPNNVQLLWIGLSVSSLNSDKMLELSSGERIVLSPKYDEILRTLERNPDLSQRFAWWLAGRHPQYRGRADARMAFFWEIQFLQSRRLEQIFSMAIRDLSFGSNNKIQVFWVASLSEPDSAMLPDLAMFINQFKEKGHSIPWLIIPPLRHEYEKDQAKAMQIASLREMHRFMSGREQFIDYSGNGPSQTSPNSLFSTIFALDAPHALDAFAQQVLVLTEPKISAEFLQTLNFVGIDAEKFSISTIASFTYLWPIEDMRRVSAIRFIQEEIGAEQLEPSLDKEKVKNFFFDSTNDLSDYVFPFNYLVDTGRVLDLNVNDIPTDFAQGFRWRLQLYLNQVAPSAWKARDRFGSEKNIDLSGPAYLIFADRFLENILAIFNEAGSNLMRLRNQRNQKSVDTLFRMIEPLRFVVKEFREQIFGWKKAREDVSRSLSKEYTLALESLKQSLQKNEGQEPLLHYDEHSITDATESYFWGFYNSPSGQTACENFRKRMGWAWDQDEQGRVRLRWYALPMKVSSVEWRRGLFTIRDIERLTSCLVDLGGYFTKAVAVDKSIFDILSAKEPEDVVNPFRRVSPTLATDRVPDAARRMFSYLIGAKPTLLQDWISRVAMMGFIRTLESADSTKITLLNIEHNLPIKASHKWYEARSYYYRDPALHAFVQEQTAVILESQTVSISSEMFGPRFVSLMTDMDAFQVAMDCVFYNWIGQFSDDEGSVHWYIRPSMFGAEPISLSDGYSINPHDLEGALSAFLFSLPWQSMNNAHPLSRFFGNFRKTVNQIKQLLEKTNDQKLKKRKDSFKVIQAKIKEWQRSGNPFYQDLAVYQEYLLNKQETA